MDVPEGAATLRFEFEKKTEPDFSAGKGAGGVGQLYINGKLAGEVEIPTTTPGQYAVAGEGLTCGYDAGQSVTRDYKAPFQFTGKIRRLTADVSGELIPDRKAQEMDIKIIMKRQ